MKLNEYLRSIIPVEYYNALVGIKALNSHSSSTPPILEGYYQDWDNDADWHASQTQVAKALLSFFTIARPNPSKEIKNWIEKITSILNSIKPGNNNRKNSISKIIRQFLKPYKKLRINITPHKKLILTELTNLASKIPVVKSNNLTVYGECITSYGNFIKRAVEIKLEFTDNEADVIAILAERIAITILGYTNQQWEEYFKLKYPNISWIENIEHKLPRIIYNLSTKIEILFANVPCAANSINFNALQLGFDRNVPKLLSTKKGFISPLVFIALHETMETAIILHAWENKLLTLKNDGYEDAIILLEIGYCNNAGHKVKRGLKAILDSNNIIQFTYTAEEIIANSDNLLDNHAILHIIGNHKNRNEGSIDLHNPELSLQEQGIKLGVLLYHDAHQLAEQLAINSILACGFDRNDLDYYFEIVINQWILNKVIPEYQKIFSPQIKKRNQKFDFNKKKYLDNCLPNGFPLPYLCYLGKEFRNPASPNADLALTQFTLDIMNLV